MSLLPNDTGAKVMASFKAWIFECEKCGKIHTYKLKGMPPVLKCECGYTEALSPAIFKLLK